MSANKHGGKKMKCLVKNLMIGTFETPEFSLKYKEEKKVDFTEQIRKYVALGYIQLKDLYTEIEKPAKSKKDDN